MSNDKMSLFNIELKLISLSWGHMPRLDSGKPESCDLIWPFFFVMK